jgi:hypothetical protein
LAIARERELVQIARLMIVLDRLELAASHEWQA